MTTHDEVKATLADFFKELKDGGPIYPDVKVSQCECGALWYAFMLPPVPYIKIEAIITAPGPTETADVV